MRYFYAFSLLFILASCQKDEKKGIERDKTDWAFYKLNGNVKSITTKSWQVNDKLEKIKTMHEDMSGRNSDLLFDEDGFITDEKSYLTEAPIETIKYNGRDKKQEVIQFMSGIPAIKTSYDWDESGKNNTAITKRNSDNSQIDRIEMKYQNGYLVTKTTLSAQNMPTEKITYINDSKGKVIEEDLYLGSDIIQYKSIFKYDKKGNQVSDAKYSADGKKLYETISRYDGDKLVKKFTNSNKGEVEYSEDFIYDTKGNITNKVVFNKADNSKSIDKFAYDDNGNRVAWNIIKNDIPLMTGQFTYDEHNNMTTSIARDATNNLLDQREYAYEYDKKGNWIKKKVKLKGVDQFIVERTISYYDNK